MSVLDNIHIVTALVLVFRVLTASLQIDHYVTMLLLRYPSWRGLTRLDEESSNLLIRNTF